ncbi:MAG: proline dehydrogenase family protein [Candidatus Micrarchaeota archaeon]|nr:proline dehydrogenase family protein [Candidatus Micrarchaeota archaeon]
MPILSRLGMVFAQKWIAGVSISDAIRKAREINGNGEKVIMNYLGEDLTDRRKIDSEIMCYKELLDSMRRNRIKGAISVKPTQLGLFLQEKLFAESLDGIAAYASKRKIFVWLDMEDYEFVEKTIDIYSRLLQKRKNVGICIQSRLRRSYDDVKRLAGAGARIRLVKGAYKYTDDISYMYDSEVDANYMRCAGYLFKNSDGFMIATHDSHLIEECRRLERRYKKRAQFAMLKGIRGMLAKELADGGEEVYIYMPFGEEWFRYSIRRLSEEGHALLLLRSVFQG